MKHRLFALLLLVAAATALPAPAHAAACTGSSGVTVVVDFDNGTTRIGCAPGDPASGYQALQQAGFSITLATGNGSGALCSIDSVPNHACPSMPPADAYWAYFHAARGGSWTYSTVGGGGYDPKPGSVEGWHFRGNRSDPPAVAPPAAPSTPKPTPSSNPTSAPKPSAKPSAASTTASTTGSAATPSTDPSASPSASPSGTAAVAPGSATPTTSPTAAASESADAATVTDASTPLRRPDDGGASWVWGVGIVAVLAAVCVGLILRRRRA